MRIAAVIPALNEAETIASVIGDVRVFAHPIVVADGCSDGTEEIARNAGATVLVHEVNRGYDAALATGLRGAVAEGFDGAVTFDADGELSIDGLSKAVDHMTQGEAALVIGVRPEPARFSERLFVAYARRRFGIQDILCGLKGYRAADITRFDRYLDVPSIQTALAIAIRRSGASLAQVPLSIRPRTGRPRFGGILRANSRILMALVRTMLREPG